MKNLWAQKAQAAGILKESLGDIKPDTYSSETFFVQFAQIINFFLGAVGVVLLLVILYAGVTLLTSQGDTDKVTQAQKMIVYGVIGVILIALSFALVNWLLLYGASPLGTTIST